MNNEFNTLISLVPPPRGKIEWELIEKTALGKQLLPLSDVMQDKEYHGEGDVLTHTRLVCEALVNLEEYEEESDTGRQILFISALLHDIGKLVSTKEEKGRIISPHHARRGAKITRELLWRTMGLCADRQKREMREAICALIKYHSFPPHAIDDGDERKTVKISLIGELAPMFTLRRLCTLEIADIMGRECYDRDTQLMKVRLFHILASELGCLDGAYKFKSPCAKRAYLTGKTNWLENDMYSGDSFEVILMSGLPGTGKDTWIRKNHPTLPVISLDDIRKEMKIKPEENQGAVLQRARDMARELLRNHTSFIWNATSLTEEIRIGQISLFEEYGANVHCVFLEAEWNENIKRNSEREAFVPPRVVESMLERMEPPMPYECALVSWESV